MFDERCVKDNYNQPIKFLLKSQVLPNAQIHHLLNDVMSKNGNQMCNVHVP